VSASGVSYMCWSASKIGALSMGAGCCDVMALPSPRRSRRPRWAVGSYDQNLYINIETVNFIYVILDSTFVPDR
jgi:hypothetical protein